LNNSPAKIGLVLKLSSSIKRRAEPGKRGRKNRAKTEQKKAKIHREKDRKGRSNTETRISLAIVFVPAEKEEPEISKKNTDEKDGEETEPEKAWVQPTPGSRTLTIIIFVQSKGIRKHRPKAFFPNTISKKKKGNREESEQGREYRNQANNTKNRGRRSNRGERE